jgi:hypothetical protein
MLLLQLFNQKSLLFPQDRSEVLLLRLKLLQTVTTLLVLHCFTLLKSTPLDHPPPIRPLQIRALKRYLFCIYAKGLKVYWFLPSIKG